MMLSFHLKCDSMFRFFDRSFSNSAPRLWNSFPNDVRNASSLHDFKLNVRQIL